MEQTNRSFFVDVWVGFHVLFLAVLVSVLLTLFNVVEPWSDLVVMGPLMLATTVVLGRFSVRHLSSLVRHLKSI